MKTEELNGTAGQLTWKISNNTLIISGNGEMLYYCYSKYCNVAAINTVIIETGVTNIREWAFGEFTSLTSIIVPNSVKSIGESAFYSCENLTSIIIPNSVISIGKKAFLNCTSLTSITIPKIVITIESWAFGCCHNLTSITNLSSVPIGISPDVFPTVRKGKLFIPIISYNSGEQIFNTKEVECTLKVPKASISAYKNAEVWKEFNIVGIEEGNK